MNINPTRARQIVLAGATSLMAAFMAMAPAVAPATGLLTTEVSERAFLKDLLANGSSFVCIEARGIDDAVLRDAILAGSRHRQVRIIVERPSQMLAALDRRDSIEVRTAAGKSLKFTSHAHGGGSALIEVSMGSYSLWRGPATWTKRAFRNSAEVRMGAGGPSEPFDFALQEFCDDFARAKAMRYAIKKHALRKTPVAINSADR